jgi:folate-dependent phosphoribosylglycinamide formyltransferase PurN
MRAVFIGYDNMLNRVIEHWLAGQTNLVGCVWVPSQTQWLTSRRGQIDFVKRRIKRRGVLKAFDEALFFLLYHATERTSPSTLACAEMIRAYRQSARPREHPPSLRSQRVNDPQVLEYLQQVKPDVVFSHCINQYFGKRLRTAAPHGVMLWHVGITPEYKGVYSPFWTMHNGDFGNFGYTLLRLNEDLDAGEIFVQGRLSNVDILHDNHELIEHKAIFASFEDVGRFIKELEQGTAKPIERPDAKPRYYSYPGLTDYLRQRWRVRRAHKKGPTPTLTAPESP